MATRPEPGTSRYITAESAYDSAISTPGWGSQRAIGRPGNAEPTAPAMLARDAGLHQGGQEDQRPVDQLAGGYRVHAAGSSPTMALSDRKPGAMNLFQSARGRGRLGVRRVGHPGA